MLASGGQKPQFWSNCDIFGAPVPTPFYRWGLNLASYSRPTVHVYLRNFVSIGLFCRPVGAKNPNFCRMAFSGVANWQQSEKVEHGCTSTNLPLSNGIKSFLYSSTFMAKSGAQLWRGKAAGLDGITCEYLLFSHPLLPGILAKLFNFMIRIGYVPVSFGQSYTEPI